MARFSYQNSIYHSFFNMTFVFQICHPFYLILTIVLQLQHSFYLTLTFVFQLQHSFYSSVTFVYWRRRLYKKLVIVFEVQHSFYSTATFLLHPTFVISSYSTLTFVCLSFSLFACQRFHAPRSNRGLRTSPRASSLLPRAIYAGKAP